MVETSTPEPPRLVYLGVDTLLGQDRTASCAPFPGGFNLIEESVGSTGFGTSQIALVQTDIVGTSAEDPDFDNVLTDFDNCPHVQNPIQIDRGSTETPTFPATTINGIGDPCECADVIGNDGQVTLADRNEIQQIVLGAAAAQALCSSEGNTDCDPADWAGVVRAQEGLKPKGKRCGPALGQ